MKTPNFVTIMLACTIASAAADPYDSQAWIPISASIRTLPSLAPGDVSVQTFRQFFRHSPLPELRLLVKACGVPAEEWDNGSSQPSFPAHLPMSNPGHLFRYNLHDGGHVYIWTDESDVSVLRADYFPASGPVAPLYLKSQ